MSLSLGTLAVLGLGAIVVGREATRSSHRSKRRPLVPDGPGGNYRLAVVESGQVLGASCGSCAFFELGEAELPADLDGRCAYWKTAAGSIFVCDEYTSLDQDESAEILWDDPSACWGWFLPEGWKVRVARPVFREAIEAAGAEQLDPVAMTHAVLDDSIADHCPIPHGDFTRYQLDVPDAPDFFPNEAVLGLYFHVLDEVERTLSQIVQTGEGLLFSI